MSLTPISAADEVFTFVCLIVSSLIQWAQWAPRFQTY